MKCHLVLVGLPGSGKSSVGRLVAQKLGADWFDIDSIIERRVGRRISEIFDSIGEPEFRAIETEETNRILSGDPSVIIPGGGWAAQAGNLTGIGDKAMTVYLKTSPETSAERLEGDGTRPLLADHDPTQRLRELLTERESFYSQCDRWISTDGKSVVAVADEVVALALSAG